MKILEMCKDLFRIKLENPSAVFGDEYEGQADSPRCYFNSSIIPYFEAIAKVEGVNEPLKVYEKQCKAMGTPSSILVIEVDHGFE